MRLIVKSTYAYLTLLLLSLLIYSCCETEQRIVGAGDFIVITMNADSINVEADTIRHAFRMYANFETEIISMTPNVGLINSSYATSCEVTYLNELLDSTLVLTCNRPMMIAGQEIAAGENLADISQIEVDVSPFSSGVDVNFSEELLATTELTEGWNTFEIQIQTNDAVLIKDELDVFFDFE